MAPLSTGYAPDLEKYLRSLKGQALESSVESLICLLKRRQIKGSEPCAVATAHILLQVVARSKWFNVDSLIDNVSRIGRRLVEAQPKELVIANIVRRVLGLIRDEAAEDRNEGASETPSDAQITPTDAVPNPDALSHQWPPSTYGKQDSAGDYITNSAKPPPDAGAAAIARAAKERGRAVIVLGGVYKLSPVNPFSGELLIEWGDSASFVNFADGHMVNSVEVRTALNEMVPPELIDIYITNLGTHSRDHLSSLIADHYKTEDVDFFLNEE